MKRSERLDVVQQVTSRNEREHAERVAAAQRHLQEMEDKHSALEKYRGEYEAGFAARSRAGFGAAGVRDFQAFLARLGEALNAQAQLVEQARVALEAVRSQWREAAQRAHVVDSLAERWQSEETRAENRREQNDTDELSSQRAATREQTK
ncbi:MAG TPA: flagellar export protein FliJ [Steroidobacteraceae bacterium]|nr:flagellar export protein FliJ [Steroidobacteraceae bacterium]